MEHLVPCWSPAGGAILGGGGAISIWDLTRRNVFPRAYGCPVPCLPCASPIHSEVSKRVETQPSTFFSVMEGTSKCEFNQAIFPSRCLLSHLWSKHSGHIESRTYLWALVGREGDLRAVPSRSWHPAGGSFLPACTLFLHAPLSFWLSLG